MRLPQRGIAKTDVCIGMATLALGAMLALGLSGISIGAGYDRIGPRFFPYVMAFGLLLIGAYFLIAGLTKREIVARSDGERTTHYASFGYLAAALILTLLLLERAGFVIACAIQFWLVARAFGSRHAVRDATVACALSLVCFLAFSNGLGLTLPSGILEGIL